MNPNLFDSEGKSQKLIIFELFDPIGPTGTDPDLEAIIMTREVQAGGNLINMKRV